MILLYTKEMTPSHHMIIDENPVRITHQETTSTVRGRVFIIPRCYVTRIISNTTLWSVVEKNGVYEVRGIPDDPTYQVLRPDEPGVGLR